MVNNSQTNQLIPHLFVSFLQQGATIRPSKPRFFLFHG